jgi:signal peptidase I
MDSSENNSSLANWLRTAAIGRNPKHTLARIIIFIAVVFIVFRLILLPIRVMGISMLPTYPDAGVHFVNRLAYVRATPQRGDVVSIRLAGDSVMYMKRIIALPGETVEFRNGHVFIDSELLPEPYEKWSCDWNRAPEKLGPNEYFVVGDNRTMAEADHVFGKADRSRIVGKVVL